MFFFVQNLFIIRKLVALIEQLKTSASERPEAEDGAVGGDGIIYQFNYRPELAKLQQTARLAELEGRLHRLETVLGATDDKLARLASGNKKGELIFFINLFLIVFAFRKFTRDSRTFICNCKLVGFCTIRSY